MGRNGKSASVFSRMVKLINDKAESAISSDDILLGYGPGRNSATAYLYKLLKLGYIEIAHEGERGVLSKETTYRVKKAFPNNYNSVMMTNEMRALNGYVRDRIDFDKSLNSIQV